MKKIILFLLMVFLLTSCGEGGESQEASQDNQIGQLQEEIAERKIEEPQKEIISAETSSETSAGTLSQKNAVSMAKDYLESSNFSQSGLIEQLIFEGFSEDDAAYAVSRLDVNWREQAATMAKGYLESSNFSQSGLREQLEFEGFSEDDANYAVSRLDVNWSEQAAAMAEGYLESSSFSRSGLIEQLIFEGFSEGDATYAADKAGF
ncbi:hypothetical protein FRZ06_13090 [Anoxybacterium hadale]|uniref:Uncharacterized protein n=1 Tax=Anoxybacterium hadale TaxID=3408580 RepID=A0ACD1ACU3_9FIRM|nr:hypothetical protein FRZ06_13090 [Clostridiales bacterium]